MSANRKSRAGGHQATLNTSKRNSNSTGLAARIKGLIGTLASWGWLPMGLADWLMHRVGPRDE